MHHTTAEPLHQGLKDRVLDATGESVAMCYQCGKCAAGCPLVEDMDFTPNQILRMLQINLPGMEEKVLRSQSIWLCLTCETCFTRCPKEVDFPKIMDYLRNESMRRGMVHPNAKKILAFHETFLASVKKTGRLFELGLIIGYKMKTGALLQDATSGPKALSRGKLKFISGSVHNKAAIAKLFEKTENKKEKKI